MKSDKTKFTDIDGYIASFPEEVQRRLQELREAVREALPDAGEAISYGIPTFKQNGGYVVYFGGYKKHVSLYPVPIGNPEFAHDLAPYASGRGTAKFPLNQELPVAVIRRVASFNSRENEKRMAAKAIGKA